MLPGMELSRISRAVVQVTVQDVELYDRSIVLYLHLTQWVLYLVGQALLSATCSCRT
jgi:hypothetical protein